MSASSRRAEVRLRGLFPLVRPWTWAVLWHGLLSVAPPQSDLDDEVGDLIAQRLAPLALAYLREHGVAPSAPARRALTRASFDVSTRSLAVTVNAVGVLDAFEAAGLKYVVTKGPGIAAAYRSRDLRPFSDIDVLVRPHDFTRAQQLLTELGFRVDARNVQAREYFARWCLEGVNLNRAPTERIDLHHRVPPWLWSPHVPSLIARATQVDVAGHTLRCARPVDNLRIAARHVVSDRNEPGKSLLVWRDVAQLAHATPFADLRATLEEDAWLDAVLGALPPGVLPRIPSSPGTSIPHALRLRLLLDERGARLGVAASQALRVPVLSGLAFLTGLLVPSERYLRMRFGDTRFRRVRWASGIHPGVE